jgi:hypothetical protein
MPVRDVLRWTMLAATLLGATAPALRAQAPSRYLYLWSGSADSTKPDFLAVLDARADSPDYGKLLATVPVPGKRNFPHHTEHSMPADGRLFANGFGAGQTFIFDTKDGAHPRLDGQFGDVKGMMHPHSFLRLPNGNVLATFQMQHDSIGMAPGGLAELTSTGALVRSVSADVEGVNRAIRPYSAAIVPALDRIVTTTTDMDGEVPVRAVQLWRLSDLKLLNTFDLPNGPRGDEGAFTAEPRLLEDGRTVLVNTFNCGLYLLHGIDGDTPSGELVASFPEKPNTYCAIPIVAGNYYLVSVPSQNAVVSLDISNPAKPREVSRVTLAAGDLPHWIAMEPNERRVVITGVGDMKHRVYLAKFDPRTGALALDERFRDAGATTPGVSFANKSWPHGGRAAAIPHGSVFSREP